MGQKEKKGVIFYFDGQYAHCSIRDISREKTGKAYSGFNFNFPYLVNFILNHKKVSPAKLVGVHYTYIPLWSERDQEIDSRQTNMINHFLSLEWNCVQAGNKKIIDSLGTPHLLAKKDDVLFTMQVMKDMYELEYKAVVFVTGDGDFGPLVQELKDRKKHVYLVYFENQISHNLENLVGRENCFCINFDTLNKKEYKTNYSPRSKFNELTIRNSL